MARLLSFRRNPGERRILRNLVRVILVTGATGTVGKALLPLLIERGDDIRALVRDPHVWSKYLTEAIGSLPEREQLVVALYYYENLTLREIGEVLGVTESRISQLHTKAVLRLKSRLQGDNLRD